MQWSLLFKFIVCISIPRFGWISYESRKSKYLPYFRGQLKILKILSEMPEINAVLIKNWKFLVHLLGLTFIDPYADNPPSRRRRNGKILKKFDQFNSDTFNAKFENYPKFYFLDLSSKFFPPAKKDTNLLWTPSTAKDALIAAFGTSSSLNQFFTLSQQFSFRPDLYLRDDAISIMSVNFGLSFRYQFLLPLSIWLKIIKWPVAIAGYVLRRFELQQERFL